MNEYGNTDMHGNHGAQHGYATGAIHVHVYMCTAALVPPGPKAQPGWDSVVFSKFRADVGLK